MLLGKNNFLKLLDDDKCLSIYDKEIALIIVN